MVPVFAAIGVFVTVATVIVAITWVFATLTALNTLLEEVHEIILASCEEDEDESDKEN